MRRSTPESRARDPPRDDDEQRARQRRAKNIGAPPKHSAHRASFVLSVLSKRAHMPRCFSASAGVHAHAHVVCSVFARAVSPNTSRESVARLLEAEPVVCPRAWQKTRTSGMLSSVLAPVHGATGRPI